MKGSRTDRLWAVAGVALLPLASALISSGSSAQGVSSGSGARVAAVPTATQTADLQAKKVGDEVQARAWITNGDYYEKALDSHYPNGSLGQAYGGEFNMTGSKGGINATIRMRAAYTNENLYLQLEWQDPTGQNDLNRRRFLFNGPDEGGVGVLPGWSSQLNDDKFAMAFDINGAADDRGTFEQNGCTVGCHGSMNPTQGVMDIWHWKTSRSNILGYVNDQYGDPTGRHTDAGDPIEVRNWKGQDDIAHGPKYVWDPSKGKQLFVLPNPEEGSVQLDPAIFLLKSNMMELRGDAVAGDKLFANTCQTCHDPTSSTLRTAFAQQGLTQTDAQLKSWIADLAHPGSDFVKSFTQTDFDNVIARIRAFTGVPGYYLQAPTLSSADLVVLNSTTVFKDGKYTVQIRRAMKTGYPDDVQFDPVVKKEYVFGVAVMDKDGKNHAGSPRQILKFLD